MLALALPLGLLIGAVIGSMGAGGSLLTVPVLVGVLGLTPYAATTASLVVVATTASTGLVVHARQKRVRWSMGLTIALLGLPASWLGSHIARTLPDDVLLSLFGLVVLVGAASMLATSRRSSALHPLSVALTCPLWSWCRAFTYLRWFAIGSVVGLLAGMFGVGGGFLIVPALVMVAGLEAHEAAGTSLLVIAVNSLTVLAIRSGAGFDVLAILPFAAVAIIGSWAGARYSSRLSGKHLQQGMALLLLLVAGWALGSVMRA